MTKRQALLMTLAVLTVAAGTFYAGIRLDIAGMLLGVVALVVIAAAAMAD